MDLRELLSRAHFAVAACGSLASARQVLRTRSCDLAVVDLFLPDGSGAELLDEIKGDRELSHIPVILISASSQIDEVRDRAQGCLGKPYDRVHLIRLAERLCMASMRGKRFLIVDDSPTFTYALADQLAQYGSVILTANSGEQALEILQRESVDCAIIDMVMPGIGGLETCRRLRARPDLPHLLVLMLTAGQNTSGRSQGISVGADQFLLKSHRMDQLCAQIQDLLRRKQPGSAPSARNA